MDHYRPIPGTAIKDLDTPCLLVDLDVVEHNLRVVADIYRDTECKMRQHTKNIKSPRLATMQIDAGGTVGGVCTAKLSEAEVMVEGGVTDILIPNQVVHKDKIARMCALARQADMKVCVDNLQNVQDLSDIADAYGVKLGVLIEVDTQMGRAGVRSNEAGVAIAKLAERLPGVDFKGVMSHQSLKEFIDHEDRFKVGRETIQICLDVKAAIEAEGIAVEMVSSGETFTIDVAIGMDGVTEVEGGTYALGGTMYDYMDDYRIANKVLGTIISTPRPGVAIGDVGLVALSERGADSLEDMPGITIDTLLDDHIVLRSDGAMPLEVGAMFVVIPSYQDMMINRWDQYIAVRDGKVEQVWDIPGRGCTQ
jgi:3-hydroxy-D-aspartate aldolase